MTASFGSLGTVGALAAAAAAWLSLTACTSAPGPASSAATSAPTSTPISAPTPAPAAGATPSAGAATAAAAEPPWVADARRVSSAVPPKLLAVLQEEIARGGPEGAVQVCREKAPALARAASDESGWQVRRVSLRNRNPRAVPDAWERAALEDFDRRAAAGEAPMRLERADTVLENGRAVQRYMRALPVVALCESCHGTADRIAPATAQALGRHYPDDRATGYRVGEIRGAMTLRRPAP